MINNPLVKKSLSQIVEKEHEDNLKKRYREYYGGETPEGIDNLIRALELPQEDIQFIADNIRETVEETIIPIINALDEGIETDEEIAEKTGIKLNIVRKILYKLYDLKIANYKRSKDPETQWFTYSWKFDKEELINQINKESESELKALNDRLAYEENNMFFICPEGHVRYNFDEASDEEFLCVCGEELQFQDNSDMIDQLKENIKMVESDLDSFNKSIE
ncbi:MAG: transcription factor E [Methanobrevibacter sp.]|jgi:transcription initiation factor TFIIE subunit alpha|uniref:Transcription factor E n=1 Tax=Methanobrevibacter thaueri TaxID=190975 RepID=A0A315XKP6_9EURY|nr:MULTISPECIES: transcription factor E [Methanobrevibacter]MBR2665391.1 transcription factor E [Methanobrevibacter sp.]MBR3197069.1 transcription factor E [Methanobrevibacter sp.]MBR7049958.1 transcription factor E [Methanobrevibacter sp.]PWB85614.1 transcription initiation factor E subunit alpha [Methanobrevibacter thaueri]